MKLVKNRGFTLLETLVVVIIIGILAGLLLPWLRLVVKRSHGAEAFANLGALVNAENEWLLEHESLTDDFEQLGLENLNDDDLYPNRHFDYYLITAQDPWRWRAIYRHSWGGGGTWQKMIYIDLDANKNWGGEAWPWLPGG